MNIDRKLAHQALTDGFTEIYGEQFRELFSTVGNQLIDLGIINGRYIEQLAFSKIGRLYSLCDDKEFNNGKISREDTIEKLKIFFSDEQVNQLYQRVNGKYVYTTEPRLKTTNMGILQSAIMDGVGESKPRKINTKHFDYFKQFYPYEGSKSCNLYGESGLGLDSYKSKNIAYYLSENKESYLIRDVAYKYHMVGAYLIREELRLGWIEKISAHVTKGYNYDVCEALSSYIKALSFDSEEVDTLLTIQKNIQDDDSFLTHKQITKRLSKIPKKVWDEMLDAFKKPETVNVENGNEDIENSIKKKLKKIKNKNL